MNKIISLLLCMTLLATAACEKDTVASDESVSSTNSTDLSEVLLQGNWKIQYYFQDKDETGTFGGYVFTFQRDGRLTFKKDNEFYTGTWQEISGDGGTKLLLQINTINFIQKLNSDWDVESYNATMIKLKDDNLSPNQQLHLARL